MERAARGGRWRSAGVVLVLGGLALGAAALALGAARLERSDALRRVLALETEAALGVPLAYRQVSVGWLPPRVELSGVVLTLPGGVLLRAPSAVLEIESSALFSGLVRVESARADNGVVEWGAEGRAMLRGPCRLEARQHAPGAWTLALEAELESGGSLRANATAPGVWRAEIDGLEIAPLARALRVEGRSGDLSGRVSGALALESAAAGDGSDWVMRLEASDVHLQAGDLAIDGALDLVAHLARDFATQGGTFELDATRARLEYAPGYEKPPGRAATVSGRLAPTSDGIAIEEIRIHLRDFEAEIETSARGAAGGRPT